MDHEGIIFSFRGAVTQEIIITLGDTLRKQVALQSENLNTNMRVFSAFVELVQNIHRYSSERREVPPAASYGIFIIGFKDGHYFLRCGNTMQDAQREEIELLLSRLENMSPQELKAFFKEQRRNPTPSESQGARLGFIELARNATSLRHSFTPQEDGSVFFSVHVVI